MKPKTKKILIIDDEQTIRDLISVATEMAGFEAIQAADTTTALSVAIDHQPDAIILDWMLPNESGVEFCRRLKKDEVCSEIPVIMLTARGDEDDKVYGLDAGADDYITKPFSPRELVARIKAVLRRVSSVDEDERIEVEGLMLDPVSHRVMSADQSIDIGPTEYRLLLFFMTHQERVYSRSQLLDHVWGGNVYVEERTVDVHIRRLRKAIGNSHEHLIQTVRGTGYRFSRQEQ